MFKRLSALALLALAVSGGVITAQRPQIGNAIRPMVKVDAPVVAITNVRVIDGTGAPARAGQTIVLRDGNIAAIGANIPVPEGATVIDGTGKSVLPGLVMLHEHTYYPAGGQVYGQYGVSFTRLYLAGGVTTMRTGGNVNGVMDITLARRAANF
jgi:dihydroorotase-like cyclic amidohydrolase